MSNYNPGHRITSYEQAREVVREHGHKRRDGSYAVPLGHATTVSPRGLMTRGADPLDAPSYAIRYHNTDVVTYYRNGVVALNHDGWLSTTTVLRWHLFTPRGLVCNGIDINARRIDRDPRVVVTDWTSWEDRREVAVSRYDTRTLYFHRRAGRWSLATPRRVEMALSTV